MKKYILVLSFFIFSFLFLSSQSEYFNQLANIKGKSVDVKIKTGNLNLSGREVKGLKVKDVTDYYRKHPLENPIIKSASTFAWTYGGTKNEFFLCIFPTNDGGYITAGFTSSFGAGGNDFLVIKLDGSGNIIWAKTYGGSNGDVAYFISCVDDGGYIVAGATGSFGASTGDCLVIKIKSNGDVYWAKIYGGSGEDWFNSISPLNNGTDGYIAVGSTSSFGAGNYELLVTKLDSSGNVNWAKTYDVSNNVYDFSLFPLDNGTNGYIGAGITTSFGTGNNDFLVLKLDSGGDIVWSKTYDGGIDDWAKYIFPLNDGLDGYIVAGYTSSFGVGFAYDFLIIRLDASGNVIWAKTYGGSGSEEVYSIYSSGDGGFIVAGSTDSFGAGSCDFLVIKLDSNGNLIWAKTYGGNGCDVAVSISLTGDGGYIVAGYTNSFGAGDDNSLVIKLDSNGNIDGDCHGYLEDHTNDVIVRDVHSSVTTQDHTDDIATGDQTSNFVNDDVTSSLVFSSPYVTSTKLTCGDGDINGDGILNATDLVLLADYLSENVPESEIDLNNSDLNGDNKVNVVDLFLLSINLTH